MFGEPAGRGDNFATTGLFLSLFGVAAFNKATGRDAATLWGAK